MWYQLQRHEREKKLFCFLEVLTVDLSNVADSLSASILSNMRLLSLLVLLKLTWLTRFLYKLIIDTIHKIVKIYSP